MYWERIAIWATALVWPILALLETTPNLLFHFQNPALPGQSLYVLSKFCGLYALILILLQAIAGMLARHNKYRYFLFPSAAWHPRVGIVAVALIMLHIALFVMAVSTRNQHFAWKLFVPSFVDGYYKFMLSIGLLALLLLLCGVLAAGFRKRLKVWRWGHRLATLALVLGLIHSFAIGSETRGYAMMFIYVIAAASITIWAWSIFVRAPSSNPQHLPDE